MQHGVTRHKKWTRCSPGCPQLRPTAEADDANHATNTTALCSEALDGHGVTGQSAIQQEHYDKRSRYCLQLATWSGTAGPQSAASPAGCRNGPRETASPAGLAAPHSSRDSSKQVSAKRLASTPAGMRSTHWVYVRNASQQPTQGTHKTRESQAHQQEPVSSRVEPAAQQPGQAPVGSVTRGLATQNGTTSGNGASSATLEPVAAHCARHVSRQDARKLQPRQQAQSAASVQQQQHLRHHWSRWRPAGQQMQQQQQPQQVQPATAVSIPPQQRQPVASQVQQQLAVQQQHQQSPGYAGNTNSQLPRASGQPNAESPVQRPRQHHILRAPSQQPTQQQLRQQQQRRQAVTGEPAMPGQLITRPAVNGNVKIVYKKSRNKLERAGVKAAVAGASLSWVNESTAPHLAAAAQAAVTAAAAASAAKQAKQRERQQSLQQRRLQRLQEQQQKRQQLLEKKRQVAAAAGKNASAGPKVAVTRASPGYKLVRIGSHLYYSTPQGLCSAATAKLLAKTTLGQRRSSFWGSTASAAAAAAAKQRLGLQWAKAKPNSSSTSSKLAQQRLAAPAGTTKRLLSSSAVARSLAVARGRNVAKKAAERRGICLHYCKRGKCDLALRGKCEKVHDPAKVAVCQQWLAGNCSNPDCKLQHKVVPELMPVCTYFLEGICSNRDCPYLHVEVAANAPACRAFLQGHCPAGAACTHKHLTLRMIKQQQKSKRKGAQQWSAGTAAAGTGATGKQQRGQQAAGGKEGGGGDRRLTAERSGSAGFVMALDQLLPQAEEELGE